MGISLKGVNLGYMGLDMSLIVEKPELQNVPYQCPAIAYIIEHPDGRILWEAHLPTHPVDGGGAGSVALAYPEVARRVAATTVGGLAPAAPPAAVAAEPH